MICKRHKNKTQDTNIKNVIRTFNNLYDELEHTKSIIHKLKRIPYRIPNSIYNLTIENSYINQDMEISCNELKYVVIGLELYCDELNDQISNEILHIKQVIENMDTDKKIIKKEE